MKKLALLTISLLILLTGCGKKNPEDLISKFEKNVNNAKSYTIKGNMEILSNEETYTYSLEANYLKDNYYKVTLVNQTNNHEQIILKNKDGVYVVTPALNKSFKFQSEWPDSSSQAYILSSLLKDIQKNEKNSLEEIAKGYFLKTSVNYPNNSELTYQKIYFDKDMNLEKVEVYNDEDIVTIKVEFTKIDLKSKLNEDDFALENLIDTSLDKEKDTTKTSPNTNKETSDKQSDNSQNKSDYSTTDSNSSSNNCQNSECDTQSSNILDSIIYPLYIPSETYLSNSEKVDTDDGNRVILTFAGDKNFVLIEEAATISNDFEVIPVYGDPIMLSDTIAAKSANSMYWTSNNVSYYLTSNDLSTEEMVTIAESLGNTTSVAATK